MQRTVNENYKALISNGVGAFLTCQFDIDTKKNLVIFSYL